MKGGIKGEQSMEKKGYEAAWNCHGTPAGDPVPEGRFNVPPNGS